MTVNQDRRTFLKSTIAAGAVGSAIGLGLLIPRTILAEWNTNAFSAESVDKAIEDALGSAASTASETIQIDAPEVAENGASVPVTVKTTLTGVESIALLADKNARPLTCLFRPGKRTRPGMSIRIKMGQTGNLIAVVKSEGNLYSAQRPVTVKAGGC